MKMAAAPGCACANAASHRGNVVLEDRWAPAASLHAASSVSRRMRSRTDQPQSSYQAHRTRPQSLTAVAPAQRPCHFRRQNSELTTSSCASGQRWCDMPKDDTGVTVRMISSASGLRSRAPSSLRWLSSESIEAPPSSSGQMPSTHSKADGQTMRALVPLTA